MIDQFDRLRGMFCDAGALGLDDKPISSTRLSNVSDLVFEIVVNENLVY